MCGCEKSMLNWFDLFPTIIIIIDSLFIGHSTKNKVEGFLECFVYQTMRLNSRLMINTCKLLMDYNNCATMLKIMVKNAQCLKNYSQLILISL